MNNRLYVIPLSSPAAAAAAMAAHKRLPHRLVRLPPGLHPWLLPMVGFAGQTVPALELDGRLVQGSRAIARVLDQVVPERPLFPSGRQARRAVEEAELWGHAELQPLPRRILRWALIRDAGLRRWLAAEAVGGPAPRLAAAASLPIARLMAARVGADDAAVAAGVRRLPGLLDHVDALVAAGVLGSDEPNAADFQILATVRVLLEFTSLAHLAEGRRCELSARRLLPNCDGPIPATDLPGLS